jgi:hypothetical protein
VMHLRAACACGGVATYTIRKGDESSVIQVGGSELYTPVCKKCYKIRGPYADFCSELQTLTKDYYSKEVAQVRAFMKFIQVGMDAKLREMAKAGRKYAYPYMLVTCNDYEMFNETFPNTTPKIRDIDSLTIYLAIQDHYHRKGCRLMEDSKIGWEF